MVHPKTTISRYALLAGALTAGWLGGKLSAIDLAHATPPSAQLAPFARLLIEDDIRQRIALYGLYVDGDGAGGRPRDLRTLADTLMTPDVVSELHPANGGATVMLYGRDVVAKSRPELDPDRAKRVAGRHYLINTLFDLVTPATATTRTTAVYFDATKKLAGARCATAGDGACGGVPVKTYMWIYEMQWRKTAAGWQISRNTLRNDN